MKLAFLTSLAVHVALASATDVEAPAEAAIPDLFGADQLADSLTADISASDDDETTCNRNGGSAMAFDGTCDSRNYTWTEQCIVEEKDGTCVTTANKCGCQVIYPTGDTSSIGSGSITGCDNACVTITTEVPQDRECRASGSAMSFDGACDSRGYIYTPNCDFKETVDDQQNVLTCMITANSCGCLWWQEDRPDIGGLVGGSKNCNDPCAVHGYPALPNSANTPGFGLVMKASFGVAAMGAAWFVL